MRLDKANLKEHPQNNFLCIPERRMAPFCTVPSDKCSIPWIEKAIPRTLLAYQCFFMKYHAQKTIAMGATEISGTVADNSTGSLNHRLQPPKSLTCNLHEPSTPVHDRCSEKRMPFTGILRKRSHSTSLG